MGAIVKTNQIVAVLAKEETTYNTAVTLAGSADAIEIYIGDGLPPAPEGLDYAFDGKIGRANGTLAPRKRTTPNGRSRKFEYKVMPKGAGTAYTSSAVLPPLEVHRFLKASGLTATFSTDRWLYTPTAAGTTFTSLTTEHYQQGEKWAQAGVLLDFGIEANDVGVPIFTFRGAGTASLPVDASSPAMTYATGTVTPPTAASVTAIIGSFLLADVKSMTYAHNREFDNSARLRQNVAGAHLGFFPGNCAPMLTFEIDKTNMVATPFHTTAGLDVESLKAAATSIPVSYSVGTTPNAWKVEFANAQLVDVKHANDNAYATMSLSFAAHPSTIALNDYCTITLF